MRLELKCWLCTAPGVVRLRGSPRTRLLENNIAQNIWEISEPEVVHTAFDQQRLLPIRLRDWKIQWNCGIAGNTWINYQWICTATQGGAQAILDPSFDSTSQGQELEHVPPTTGLLHSSVLGERCSIDWRGLPTLCTMHAQSTDYFVGGHGAFEILAKGQQYKGGHVFERDWGHLRGHGSSRVHQSTRASISAISQICG